MRGDGNRPKRTERIFYTFKETKEKLSVTNYGLRKLMQSRLPYHRIGKKIVFLKKDVAEWRKGH